MAPAQRALMIGNDRRTRMWGRTRCNGSLGQGNAELKPIPASYAGQIASPKFEARDTMAINKKKSAQGKQTRAAKRCSMVASAEVTDLGSNTRLSARTSEVGIGGCYVDAMNPFPEGTDVQVRILRDQGTFETKAKVVYCDSTMGMGLAFTEMTPEHRSLLEDWLAEIVSQLKSA
jgi:PilZ domain